MGSATEEKWIKHYSSGHEILLVGEGDFSFAACLARAFGNASNMVATSLDSAETLRIKHPTAAQNLLLLEDKGCTIIHQVDASSMSEHHLLSQRIFDRIVFNFPHAGFIMSEHTSYQISLHRDVVGGFLKNAYEMVKATGEVHITHKTTYPFSEWKIVQLAEEVGLELVEKVKFYLYQYPGYENKRGDGHRSNGSFPVGESSTFKFAK
ncbi:hypothetical protein Salat_0300500 [Sesamum alatum]|uniref:25S rRNA (uridine-N(3))-methyltransferase BMT5-like domain-containing protein n=1 Tax=Sesamum alatum TaxID=300844 RepID=A0AAE2CYU7_9LAMI|nr:hypothetical protein Salat_0300500 [Sesamum alatum]